MTQTDDKQYCILIHYYALLCLFSCIGVKMVVATHLRVYVREELHVGSVLSVTVHVVCTLLEAHGGFAQEGWKP